MISTIVDIVYKLHLQNNQHLTQSINSFMRNVRLCRERHEGNWNYSFIVIYVIRVTVDNTNQSFVPPLYNLRVHSGCLLDELYIQRWLRLLFRQNRIDI